MPQGKTWPTQERINDYGRNKRKRLGCSQNRGVHGDDIVLVMLLHKGHSFFRMPSFLSGFNQQTVHGYPGSTWAGLMRAQAPRVAVGGR